MAGVAGFEPASAGVKVPCLTTWLHPNVRLQLENFPGLLPPAMGKIGVEYGNRTHDL